MTRSLVLARVGAASLHPCWIDRSAPRDWDLRLVPYEPLPPQDGLDCVVGDVIPGPKWAGLRQLLTSWDGWRKYDHVWLPDDDIYASQDTISRMFAVARAARARLFAPALHEASHYAHFLTMVNRRFFGRWVGFVEIMVPGFSTPVLERLLPTLELSRTGWGWGLDPLWAKLLDYEGLSIIDGTPVLHTRPVGGMRDVALARAVHAEAAAIRHAHDCPQVHTTFAAFGADVRPLDLSPERLLAELVTGYTYLFERDPRVLAWIAEYQRRRYPAPAYPDEGTPLVTAGRA